MYRAVIILATAFVAMVAAGMARATPFTPTDDHLILEQLPDGRDAATATLRRMHAALAASPGNRALALSVARRDIAQSRRNADPRWLGRAEAALAPWPASIEAPADTNLLHATILQSNHDFPASQALLDAVLKQQPTNAQALLVRASVRLVIADYAGSRSDCGRIARSVLGLVPDTCTAAVMALTGYAPQALRALTLSLTQNAGETGDTRVWTATLAAELAARLDDPSAETRFRAALALDGNDPYLLGAWSDWLLDHGRAAEAETLLASRTRIDPLLLRLTLAQSMLKETAAAANIADLGGRFEAARLRGDTVHRREQARFTLLLLHRPAEALVLARANWAVQRECADARILLESALAARQPAAASPVLDWMRSNQVQDTRLTELAGRITALAFSRS